LDAKIPALARIAVALVTGRRCRIFVGHLPGGGDPRAGVQRLKDATPKGVLLGSGAVAMHYRRSAGC